MPLMTSYLYIWFISMVRKEAARLITVRNVGRLDAASQGTVVRRTPIDVVNPLRSFPSSCYDEGGSYDAQTR